MDWELKATSWGFEELERESEHKISSQVGPSNGSDEQKGNCFVGLKLGRFGDLGQVSLNMWEDSRVSTMVSTSPLVTSKRARVCVNGAHTVSCLVDGCKADLSKCRDYHRRHKVCEIHSKTPKVIVGGQEQRFCQQCSRFHKLVEFDEVKRSCRKRLDGHNRRRRKLQPKSLSLNSGSLYSNHQGTRVLPFENPLLFSSTSKMSPTWAGVIKTEEDTMVNDDGSNRMNLEVSLSKPLINNDTLSKNDGTDRKMLFSDELPRVLDSDSALSLLSSSLTQFSRLSLSHKDLQPDSNLISQPLVAELQYNNVAGRYQSQSADGETMNSVLFPGETDAKLYCQGIFHLEPYESSQNEMPQTFPFSWE